MALFVETATTGQDDVFGGGPETRFWGGGPKNDKFDQDDRNRKNDVFFAWKKHQKKHTSNLVTNLWYAKKRLLLCGSTWKQMIQKNAINNKAMELNY